MKFALSPEQTQFADTLDALLAKSDVARSWAAGDHETRNGRLASTG
ncbi:hypothetical protein [Kibdelosporangium philippinense]